MPSAVAIETAPWAGFTPNPRLDEIPSDRAWPKTQLISPICGWNRCGLNRTIFGFENPRPGAPRQLSLECASVDIFEHLDRSHHEANDKALEVLTPPDILSLVTGRSLFAKHDRGAAPRVLPGVALVALRRSPKAQHRAVSPVFRSS